MHAAQRHHLILQRLAAEDSVDAMLLAAEFKMAPMTVRRDLDLLARQGRLVRVHGGAISLDAAATAAAVVDRPNPKVKTVGVIVPSSHHYFFDVVRAIRDGANAAGCRIVVGVSNNDEKLELDQVKRMLGMVDALIMTPSRDLRAGSPLQRVLGTAQIPVVVVERAVVQGEGNGEIESVRTDHLYGAELAVRHLATIGHRTMGLARLPLHRATRVERGFRQTTRALGLGEQHVWVFPDPARVDPQTAARDVLTKAREAGCTALIVHEDDHAAAMVEAAAEAGLRVPQDLAIVAYYDEVAGLAAVPLTAVRPPKYDLGRVAFGRVLERMQQVIGDEFRAIHSTSLLPTLVVRQSTETW
ncbi:MAG TPA: substrate-binding domain-containing protein [Candidatus Lumbricidophila sp.]|nr:substrate-binding domain-containing protein [Candidatus Lumbricidophila sp.]